MMSENYTREDFINDLKGENESMWDSIQKYRAEKKELTKQLEEANNNVTMSDEVAKESRRGLKLVEAAYHALYHTLKKQLEEERGKVDKLVLYTDEDVTSIYNQAIKHFPQIKEHQVGWVLECFFELKLPTPNR